jgi:hypothetical protein
MWLLVGFGYVRHLVTGEPLSTAIEGGSIWVNPSLLIGFAILFSWLISRRMGVWAGVFFAVTFVTLPNIDWFFHSFRPGHHGLQVASSLGTALCLVLGGLGWVKKQPAQATETDSNLNLRFFRPLELMSDARARRYFVAAGIFTGLGLWIGATVQFFSIGALAVGSVLMVFFMPEHLTTRDTDYVPGLWRVWGMTAGIVGAVFYLVEYFPSHMAMRLEVNNPVYSLTVVCVGELMAQLTGWRVTGRHPGLPGCLRIAAAVGGIALVPILFIFGLPQWHNMRDLQMSRLHNFITEFYTYANFRSDGPLRAWFFDDYGILPVFLAGAVALSGRRRTGLYEWAGLWLSFFLCLFSLLLTLWEVRFCGLHAAMSAWLMVIVGHIAWRNFVDAPAANRLLGITVVLSALVLAQGIYFTARQFSMLEDICEGQTVKKEFVDAAMKKHLAEGLRDANRGRPMRAICDPDEAPALYYFGGIPTVTSLYWENLRGVHDAAEFFTDHGDAEARRVATERGLTHVLVTGSDKVAAEFNYIKTGSTDLGEARPTLLARLQPNRLAAPPWIVWDKNLAQIGRRQFSLETDRGTATLNSLMTVYHIEP